MFWLDPFFYLFSGMVLLDIGVLGFGFFKVRRLLPKKHVTSQPIAMSSLAERLRDHQNRPV